MGARYYNPQTGRFTQADPSGQEANRYLYAGANPVMFNDPSGLFVGIPSYYQYCGDGLWDCSDKMHDYCSISSDTFISTEGGVADFTGPCSRHDVCYDLALPKDICDGNFQRDLEENCADAFGPFDYSRYVCYTVAAGMESAVLNFGTPDTNPLLNVSGPS